jgi:uncharacterized membrane protein YphA (DoxX/SURF4 family)
VNIAILILRVAIGAIFIVAGISKIGHAGIFAQEIAGFRLLPAPLIAPLAVGLPFFELLLGAYLVIGLYTRIAAVVGTVQLVIFAAAIASAVLRGMSVSCGCFGPNDITTTSWPEVARDAALACVAAFVAWRAPGMLALDRRIGNA